MKPDSTIVKTADFNVIKNALDKAPPETLVVFDADDVLFHHALDHVLTQKKYVYKKLIGQNNVRELYTIILNQRKTNPVDERFISLIKELQDKEIKTLSLTNAYALVFAQIHAMQNWRINELKQLDYHFDKSWCDTPEKIFDTMNGKSPSFKEGVLFTQDLEKGPTLKIFLDYIKFKPDQIIFIDDNKENIESVEQFSKENSIHYLGIHYTAAQDNRPIDFDQRRGDYQLDVLIKEKRWISDKEIDQQLQNI